MSQGSNQNLSQISMLGLQVFPKAYAKMPWLEGNAEKNNRSERIL